MASQKRKVVVSLRGAMPAHGEPNEAVVKLIEELLRDAKAGAITGIGAFWIGPAERVFRHWEGGTASQHDMVAGAALLSFGIMGAVAGDV